MSIMWLRDPCININICMYVGFQTGVTKLENNIQKEIFGINLPS